MTVNEYLAEWLQLQRVHLQPTTWNSYRQTIDCYLAPALGATPLDAVEPRQLERLYSELLAHGGRGGRPLALRSIRYVHAVLHKALADAVRTGLLQANISDRARLPRHDPRAATIDGTVHAWTADQARRFLELSRQDHHGELWAVALGTGMRRGELLGLRHQDVDLTSGTVRVATALTLVDGRPQLKGTKTSRIRHLHLDPHTAAALTRETTAQQSERRRAGDEWRNDLDLVFTDAVGTPLIPQRITHRFRRLVRRLPVPTIRLHDVRHTHATLLLQAGVSIKVVSERLGHATIALTMDTYAHVLPAMDRDAAERFGALLD